MRLEVDMDGDGRETSLGLGMLGRNWVMCVGGGGARGLCVLVNSTDSRARKSGWEFSTVSF